MVVSIYKNNENYDEKVCVIQQRRVNNSSNSYHHLCECYITGKPNWKEHISWTICM